LEDADDELARREIVIDEDDLVQLRPLGLRLGSRPRPGRGNGFAHRTVRHASILPSEARMVHALANSQPSTGFRVALYARAAGAFVMCLSAFAINCTLKPSSAEETSST